MCYRCEIPGRSVESGIPDCHSLESLGTGDLLVIVGTGDMGCTYNSKLKINGTCDISRRNKDSMPSLHGLERAWTPETTVVHFPIRTLNALSAEKNLFNVSCVIPDNSFFKPVSDEGGSGELASCHSVPKVKDLLYVARFKKYKGQLKFLVHADPQLLDGYTVHFYGALSGPLSEDYIASLEETAHSRGITIRVHRHVSKAVLMEHICRSTGQILWPALDNNPRAAYEGLYAGIPLMLSTRAGVPDALFEQSFVHPISPKATTVEFNEVLVRFLADARMAAESADMRRSIYEYTQTVLKPENVYGELCYRAGICARKPADGQGIGEPKH